MADQWLPVPDSAWGSSFSANPPLPAALKPPPTPAKDEWVQVPDTAWAKTWDTTVKTVKEPPAGPAQQFARGFGSAPADNANLVPTPKPVTQQGGPGQNQPATGGAKQQTYDTQLTPPEERQFQTWKQQYAPTDSGEDYDLRGAFKAGVKPAENGHWPDTFKKPNHPTFSTESIYAKDRPDLAGHWEGDTYVPPKQPWDTTVKIAGDKSNLGEVASTALSQVGNAAVAAAGGAVKDVKAAGDAVGRIASAVGDGFGNQSLIAISPEDVGKLDAVGIFGKAPLQQVNEAVISFIVASGDAAARTYPAVLSGLHQTIVEGARGLGLDESHANSIANEVIGNVDIYVTSRMAGQPGIPGALPKASDMGVLPKATRDFLKEAEKTKPQPGNEFTRRGPAPFQVDPNQRYLPGTPGAEVPPAAAEPVPPAAPRPAPPVAAAPVEAPQARQVPPDVIVPAPPTRAPESPVEAPRAIAAPTVAPVPAPAAREVPAPPAVIALPDQTQPVPPDQAQIVPPQPAKPVEATPAVLAPVAPPTPQTPPAAPAAVQTAVSPTQVPATAAREVPPTAPPSVPAATTTAVDQWLQVPAEAWKGTPASRETTAPQQTTPVAPQQETSPASQPEGVGSWHSTDQHVGVAEPARVQSELADPQVARRLDQTVTVDRTYDVPYLGSYAKDGRTVFIDRHLPATINVGGRQIDPTPFLLRHETVEKALIDAKGYTYQGAHEIATGAEHADLIAAGIDPRAYETALKPFIKDFQSERLTRVPPALDMTPYSDTQAKALEQRMALAQAPDMPALRKYASSVVGDKVRSISLIGSTAAKGRGNDLDLLYDLGQIDLPANSMAAEAKIEALAESIANADYGGTYDTFFKAGDRYFHISSGAGQAVVENTTYGREQAGKPSVVLAGNQYHRRPISNRPLEMLQFIIGNGGLKPSAELRAIGAHRIPGLISNRGMATDYMREAWAEAGYAGGDRARAVAETSPADFLTALDNRINTGQRYYPIGEGEQVAPDKGAVARDKEKFEQARSDVVDMLTEHGVAAKNDPFVDRAAYLVVGEGMAPDLAYEAAVNQVTDEELTNADKAAINDATGVPFFESVQPEAEGGLAQGREYERAVGEVGNRTAAGQPRQGNAGLPQRGEDQGAKAGVAKAAEGAPARGAGRPEAGEAAEAKPSVGRTEGAKAAAPVKLGEAQRYVEKHLGKDWTVTQAPESGRLFVRQRRGPRGLSSGIQNTWDELRSTVRGIKKFGEPEKPVTVLASTKPRFEPVRTAEGVRDQSQMFSPKETLATPPKKAVAVEQKPLDIGLFAPKEAEAPQGDLFGETKASTRPLPVAPPFYSAVARAIDEAKLPKAGADQWLGYLRNRAGVKEEEINWLGLPEWLKEQTGTVTKEQVADFIRANQIEVRDVQLGGKPTERDEVVPTNTAAAPFLPEWNRLNAEISASLEKTDHRGNPEAGRLMEERDSLHEKMIDATIEEMGGLGRKPKFGQWQLPGGENYRELLLTLPDQTRTPEPTRPTYTELPAGYEPIRNDRDTLRYRWGVIPSSQVHARPINGYFETKEAAIADALRFLADRDYSRAMGKWSSQVEGNNFTSGHFSEPNVVAHIRFNDRYTSADGTSYTPPQKTLFIEEIQSDWHQKGRKQGYQGEWPEGAKVVDDTRPGGIPTFVIADRAGNNLTGGFGTREGAENYLATRSHASGVPDAPFKTTWPELALKRMVRYAAENGYDQIAWTPGEVQEERYWGNQTVSEAVDRFKEIAKPESIGKLADDVFGRQMASAVPLDVVDGGVLAVLKHDQVREAVIAKLPVDVVDILRAKNLSADDLFGNPDVVASRLSVDSRRTAALGLSTAIKNTGTAIRAKLRGLSSGGHDIEVLPALRASNLNSREIAGLLSPQSIFHLGAGAAPEESAAARARAEAAAGTSDKLVPAELARLLNAHVEIVYGRGGLLKHGFEVPPGEGMRAFYDRMLPNIANKIGKRFGARVEQTQFRVASQPHHAGIQGKASYDLAVHSLPITDAMRAGAMQGFPQFQTVPTPKPRFPVGSVERETIKNDTASIVSRIAGKKVAIWFSDEIPLSEAVAQHSIEQMAQAAKEQGLELNETIGGTYRRFVDGGVIIHLALNDPSFDPRTTAGHEAWHAIWYTMTPEEQRVFTGDIARGADSRLRRLVAAEHGVAPDSPWVMDMPEEEIGANAFQRYRRLNEEERGVGLHIALRRAFDRFLQMLRQIARMLMRRGITKPEDIFEKARKGEYAERVDEAAPREAASSAPKLPQTSTPEFRRWFGESKVVDAEGKPLVVYHGTVANFDTFDPQKLGSSTRHPSSELGFFFSGTPDVASLFTESLDMSNYPAKLVQRPNANVMPAYLSIKNPFEMSVEKFREIQATPYGEDVEREQPEASARYRNWIADNKALLLAKGYDGIHVKGDPAYADRFTGEEYAADAWVAFEPTQIKSAIGNRGTFDPSNPSILASTKPFRRTPPAKSPVVSKKRLRDIAPARQFKQFWTSTFQPELVSDKAMEADPLFARYRSASAQEKDAIYRQSESEWNFWNRRSDAQRIRFMHEVETGTVPTDPTVAAMAKRYRAMLDANWALEKQFGSQAGFVEDYFPHIWETPEDWRRVSAAMTAQLGPTWFQKERTIDLIDEGVKAGLKLRYTNPVDIVTHRLLSGVDMRQRMELLQKLQGMNLAETGVDDQRTLYLTRRGWQAINAPDRHRWLISPDVGALWKNGVEAKGLWQAEHIGGGIFRGWMALKNVWVPIKLALSMFHPLHVLHIDQANSLARGWSQITKGGNFAGGLKSMGEGMVTLPTVGLIHARRGAVARAAWVKRPQHQTPEEKAMVALMTDGGFVPQLSEQLKINAKRQLATSIQSILRGQGGAKDYVRFAVSGFRHMIEALQAPLFEKWIPSLKASAYLDEAAALLKRRPDLMHKDIARRIALRAIAKSIDNRYGEMNYGTLFWNRSLKDAGIGSFLSLGWNLGFAREFGGAAVETVTRPMGLFEPFKPSQPRRMARNATNKMAFAVAYVTTAMVIAGVMTYLFTGKKPEGNDYIFPRLGGENPDGSPRRMSTMFYTREVPMLMKHIQERGGNIVGGFGQFVWNKLMFEPFQELMNNRDYYGYNIWDESAPVYQQVWQAVKGELGNQLNPISLSGAGRAAQLSGKQFDIMHPETWGDTLTAPGVIPSIFGFNPAPAYVEKSAVQNRITYLYDLHVAPVSRPMAAADNLDKRLAVRDAILIAKRDNNADELKQAYQDGIKLGLSVPYMRNIGKEPTDVYLFSRLPDADQVAILQQASPEESKTYWPKAHRKVKQQIASPFR